MLLQSSVTATHPCCDMQILVKKNDTNTTIKKKKKELRYSTMQKGGGEGRKERDDAYPMYLRFCSQT